MNEIKIIIAIIAFFVFFKFFMILGEGILDFASLMVPNDKDPIESINDDLQDAGDWFFEKSGRSKAERDASMEAAGLYYNPETGRYEEDEERHARYLDERFGKLGGE